MKTLLKPKTSKNTIKFIKKRLLAVLLLPFVLFGVWFLYQKNHTRTSYAADPLVVTYEGSGPPAPVFNITGMLPGDEISKTFNVKNEGSGQTSVNADGVKVNETKSYAGMLDIKISDLTETTTYFNGKLQAFFDSPLLNLGTLAANETKTFKAKITFPLSAGNEYQDANVTFNIMWLSETSGSVTPTPAGIVLPQECSTLQGKITKVIEGTDGNDRINASNDSELILAKNGDDRISGLGGDDCVVGGGGNDRIQAGQGKDIVIAGDGNDDVNGNDDNDTIYGGAGDDEIDGGANDDTIYGGQGSDQVQGSSGNDTVEGNEGNDDINGGSGNDTLSGNDGNDNIDGGEGNDQIKGGSGSDELDGDSGQDQLFGEAGNDAIKGGSQNDTLNGGANTDSLDGDSGTDTCIEGETLTSCEL